YDLELTGAPGDWNWQLVKTGDTVGQGYKSVDLRLQVAGAQSLALEGDLLRVTTQAGEVKLPLPQIVGVGAQPDVASARVEGNQVILPVMVPAWGTAGTALAKPGSAALVSARGGGLFAPASDQRSDYSTLL